MWHCRPLNGRLNYCSCEESENFSYAVTVTSVLYGLHC